MAELIELAATPARILLLHDVANGLVADDADFAPMLDLGEDGTTRVAEAVWLMKRAGWVEQVTTDRRWSLTDLGRRVLDGGGTNG